MLKHIQISKFLMFLLISMTSMLPADTTADQRQTWRGQLADGSVICEDRLLKILADHKKWFRADQAKRAQLNLHPANLNRANLMGADLSKACLPYANLSYANLTNTNLSDANLENADLSQSHMYETNLSGAHLWEADLSSAYMYKANLHNAKLQKANLCSVNLASTDLSNGYLIYTNLSGASLEEANFSSSDLSGAKLHGAKFRKANLSSAKLEDADMSGAELWKADLSGADFTHVNLESAIFERKRGALPDIPTIATAKGLSTLNFKQPDAAIELRSAFKNAGFREQEREMTYAIKRNNRKQLWQQPGILRKVEAGLNYVFFELPSAYGMRPGRPLLILLVLVIFPFWLIYLIFLAQQSEDGIWKVWLPERVRKEMGSTEPEKLFVQNWSALGYALQFSILSAFSIGWRDLNVGNWISRMQPREYTLRATGWARFFSGLQSLISVYLLALAVLSYFGRPFE